MSDEEKRICFRLIVSGFVQSVGYRMFATDRARKLGLDGWVRNRFDGTVEILVAGPTKAVEEFIGLCYRGPEAARVDDIAMNPDSPPKVKGFSWVPSF